MKIHRKIPTLFFEMFSDIPWKKALESMVGLVFPRRCPGCDIILLPKERKAGFCKKCQSRVHKIPDCHCQKCGKMLRTEAEYCGDCKTTKHFFVQNKAVYLYQGQMKPSMYHFKYGNRREYAKTFAQDAAKQYGDWIKRMGMEAIVPVPMYRGKERRRGYNQATVFAKELGKQMELPVYTDLVIRIRDTAPQKNLNQVQRKYNMKNAFKIKRNGVKLSHVLVVDDIYTTGSTMDGVAQVLLSAGVDEVYCLSVCIGKNY
jgi:ComF family protein